MSLFYDQASLTAFTLNKVFSYSYLQMKWVESGVFSFIKYL